MIGEKITFMSRQSSKKRPEKNDSTVKIAIITVVGTILTALITAVIGPSVIKWVQPTPTAIALISHAPSIQDVRLEEEVSGAGNVTVVQKIKFQDLDGDASLIDYAILRTTGPGAKVEPGIIPVPREQQKQEATIEGRWMCQGGQYSVTLRAIIEDQGGNKSKPYEYTINCR
jgi:hypothetical protein